MTIETVSRRYKSQPCPECGKRLEATSPTIAKRSLATHRWAVHGVEGEQRLKNARDRELRELRSNGKPLDMSPQAVRQRAYQKKWRKDNKAKLNAYDQARGRSRAQNGHQEPAAPAPKPVSNPFPICYCPNCGTDLRPTLAAQAMTKP